MKTYKEYKEELKKLKKKEINYKKKFSLMKQRN